MSTVSPLPAGNPVRGARDGARRCVVTRKSMARAHLVRFALAPDGTAVPDLAETLPGRGFWVRADRASVDALARSKSRSGRPAIGGCTPGIADRVEALLAARCIAHLGLARRAGQMIVGRERLQAAALRSDVAAVLAARDTGPAASIDVPRDRTFALLDAAELGRACGRGEARLIGIAPGRIAQLLLRDLGRLAGFRDNQMTQERHGCATQQEPQNG